MKESHEAAGAEVAEAMGQKEMEKEEEEEKEEAKERR
jgi:hypothetical protein